jgi:UDPglucose 6-dehydrogenase
MRQLYQPLIDAGTDYIETDLATAELAKHASNAFLSLKISFANALARLCERTGADVVRVTEIMGRDSRIAPGSFNAGLGWGGSCFPKDLVAFERLASRVGYQFPLLREVARLNEEAVDAALEKVREAVWNLEEKRIAILGLAFKPDTDDVRFSPAVTLARRLAAEGATVVGYDPRAGEQARAELPGLELANDPYGAAAEAHCAVLCTEWEELRNLDLEKLKEVMVEPVLVDGRNVFDPEDMRRAGFAYYPMGRPPIA